MKDIFERFRIITEKEAKNKGYPIKGYTSKNHRLIFDFDTDPPTHVFLTEMLNELSDRIVKLEDKMSGLPWIE